jgi:hypothetical protein
MLLSEPLLANLRLTDTRETEVGALLILNTSVADPTWPFCAFWKSMLSNKYGTLLSSK